MKIDTPVGSEPKKCNKRWGVCSQVGNESCIHMLLLTAQMSVKKRGKDSQVFQAESVSASGGIGCGISAFVDPQCPQL
jgi:hypothetical protein